AVTHGLLAKALVLHNESQDGFNTLLERCLARFSPVDEVELSVVEDMVAALWRTRRAWAIESEWINSKQDDNSAESERSQIACAFNNLADTHKLGLLHRYESRM